MATEAQEKITRGTINEIIGLVHTAAEAEGLDYPKRVSDVYTHIVMRVITDILAQKKSIVFPTGLSLAPVFRPARKGHNPQKPGEIIDIPARWTIKAKPGTSLKVRLNPTEEQETY